MQQSFWDAVRDFVWVPREDFGSDAAPADADALARLAYRIWEAEGRPDGCAAKHWQAALAVLQSGGELPAESVNKQVERLQFDSDLAEVQLLLDFISGRSDRAFEWEATPVVTDNAAAVTARLMAGEHISMAELQQVATIRFPPDKGRVMDASDAVLLIAVRDKLNRFVAPASGLTIAFTLRTWALFGTMFWREQSTRHWARWQLANRAFPSLGLSLVFFELSAQAMFWGALVATLFTLGTSYDVANGQARVDRITTLDHQQTQVLGTIAALEGVAGAPNVIGGSGKGYVVRYCQKPMSDPLLQTSRGPVQEFDSPQQADVCDQLQRVSTQLASEYNALGDWYQEMQQRCATSWIISLGGWVSHSRSRCAASKMALVIADPSGVAPPPQFFRVVDVLSVFTNILLPVLYGLIGSAVAALRSIVTKVSGSTLAPWDAWLMWTRLLLGAMAGASIGLFFSPAGTNLQGSPGLGTLSLAAVAFLAGYAVDGLFALFDQVIERLFRMEPDTRRR